MADNLGPLVLLTGVLRGGAAADFARAVREDDPALYARAYAALLEKDMQRGFAEYLAREVLYDDNLFARRAYAGRADGGRVRRLLHDLAVLQALTERADDLPPRIGGGGERGAAPHRPRAGALRRELGRANRRSGRSRSLPRQRIRDVSSTTRPSPMNRGSSSPSATRPTSPSSSSKTTKRKSASSRTT